METPPAAADSAALPRRYGHILKVVEERPWALLPSVLTFMSELLRFRSEGGRLTAEEIEDRLAIARAENGPRAGGVNAGGVAVIPMYGLLSQRTSMMAEFSGGTSIDELRDALRSALNDPQVGAVVFDIDSPGGSVDGLPEFAAELRSARAGSKPIVGVANTLAASAAWWLLSSMSEVVITPSGEVGSIGVYATHQDMSRAEDMAGVKTTLVSAGKYKVEGNPFEPLDDTARSAIQEQVDTFHDMFLADVAEGRAVSKAVVASTYGEGRTLLAKAAKAAGMVDRIDTLEATVLRLQPKATRQRPAAAAISHPEPAAIAASTVDPAWNARIAKRLRSPRR